MSTKIIAVRHGYSVSNDLKFFTGQLDISLTEKGREQARLCGELFKALYADGKSASIDGRAFELPSAIYTSDLCRAYETALPIADALGISAEKTEELREIYAGEWEGMPFVTIDERYPEQYGVWKNDIGRAHCVGGEALCDFFARIERAVRRMAERHDGECIVLVTHATPIRVMCTLASKIAPEDMGGVSWVSNASVSFFEYDGDFHLVKANVTEHLGDLKTDLPRGV